jgi:hypothetical protein
MGRKTLLNFLEEYTKDKKFEHPFYARKTYFRLSEFKADFGTISCMAEECNKSDNSSISISRIYPNLSDLVEYIPNEQTLPKCTESKIGSYDFLNDS